MTVYFCIMSERYTIAITNNPGAGSDMISILIIDTAPENNNSEVFNGTIHRSQKISTLHPFMEQFGHDVNIIDISA
jgi:hypothetical protein